MNTEQFRGWHKATKSANGQGSCVEIGEGEGMRGIRDTTLAQSPVIAVTDGTFALLTNALRAGQLHA